MNLPNYKKCGEFIGVMFIVFSGFAMNAFYKINNFETFVNLDEILWYGRSRIFWDKILGFDFSGLIQSAQPGITVYWFTGFMMKFIDFDFSYANLLVREKEAAGLGFNEVANAEDPVIYHIYEKISLLFNLPLLFLSVIFFILFYYLLRKIGFNKIISLFALYFLVTNTFLFFWTTPSDKMLNIFITLSLLTFLVYLDEKPKRKYLIFSAIFGAWAVLSKLSALFIAPFYLLVYAFYFWPLDKYKLRSMLKDFFVWFMIFVPVCIMFLPTIVTNPVEINNLIMGNGGNVYETNYNIGSYTVKMADYLQTLLSMFSVMSTNSFVFFAILVAMFMKKKYRALLDISPRKHILAIGAYVILFIIMVSIVSWNHDIRFMAPAFVMLNVLAAVGFYNIMEIVRKNIKVRAVPYYSIALVVLIFSQFLTIFTKGLLFDEVIKKYFSH